MVIYETRIDVKVRSSDLLAGLMESNGYSVRELAARVGVSHSTIGHLRAGTRQYVKDDVAKKIAKALRVKPTVLFEVRTSTVYREVPGYRKAGKAA